MVPPRLVDESLMVCHGEIVESWWFAAERITAVKLLAADLYSLINDLLKGTVVVRAVVSRGQQAC